MLSFNSWRLLVITKHAVNKSIPNYRCVRVNTKNHSPSKQFRSFQSSPLRSNEHNVHAIADRSRYQGPFLQTDKERLRNVHWYIQDNLLPNLAELRFGKHSDTRCRYLDKMAARHSVDSCRLARRQTPPRAASGYVPNHTRLLRLRGPARQTSPALIHTSRLAYYNVRTLQWCRIRRASQKPDK